MRGPARTVRIASSLHHRTHAKAGTGELLKIYALGRWLPEWMALLYNMGMSQMLCFPD